MVLSVLHNDEHTGQSTMHYDDILLTSVLEVQLQREHLAVSIPVGERGVDSMIRLRSGRLLCLARPELISVATPHPHLHPQAQSH